jgi:integrase
MRDDDLRGQVRRHAVPPRPDIAAKPAGLAPKTVKNIHRMLHRAFKDAVAWNYLVFNPAEHASLPRDARSGRNRPKPWTLDELAAWLRVALDDRFAGMWVLAATTGLRRSELAGAERDLLDLDRATLTVENTWVVVKGHATDSDGKTEGSRRTISLDPFTVAALRRHIEMLDGEREAFGASYPDHGKLMCFEEGRRLHPDTITSRFNRLVDQAGVRRIRLHDVRHTYATLARDLGVNGKIVTDRLGHANESVTQQIYTHKSTGQDRAAAELIAGLIAQALGPDRVVLKGPGGRTECRTAYQCRWVITQLRACGLCRWNERRCPSQRFGYQLWHPGARVCQAASQAGGCQRTAVAVCDYGCQSGTGVCPDVRLGSLAKPGQQSDVFRRACAAGYPDNPETFGTGARE